MSILQFFLFNNVDEEDVSNIISYLTAAELTKDDHTKSLKEQRDTDISRVAMLKISFEKCCSAKNLPLRNLMETLKALILFCNDVFLNLKPTLMMRVDLAKYQFRMHKRTF